MDKILVGAGNNELFTYNVFGLDKKYHDISQSAVNKEAMKSIQVPLSD